MMDKNAIDNPVVKLTVAAASATGAQVIDAGARAGTTVSDLLVVSWPNLAAALAAFYSLLLVTEWFWKKFWRPLLERLGWIKPRPRLVYTAQEIAERDDDDSVRATL